MVRSSNSRVIFNDIKRSIEGAVDSLFSELNTDASKITPIRTGRARRGWRKVSKYRIGVSGVIVENPVPYIGLLDQGYSRQAKDGIVAPTLERLLRRRTTI